MKCDLCEYPCLDEVVVPEAALDIDNLRYSNYCQYVVEIDVAVDDWYDDNVAAVSDDGVTAVVDQLICLLLLLLNAPPVDLVMARFEIALAFLHPIVNDVVAAAKQDCEEIPLLILHSCTIVAHATLGVAADIYVDAFHSY